MLSERSTSLNLVEYGLDYERIIGDIENPNYRDIKFDVYIDDEYFLSTSGLIILRKQSPLLQELIMMNLYQKNWWTLL